MKKKLIAACAAVLVIFGAVFAFKAVFGICPYKNLNADDIESVSLFVLPPGTEVTLERDDIEELTEILHNVRIYNRSWDHLFSGGQNCVYTITFKNGSETVINAANPSLIIDGKGYRTEYEPCERLNNLANTLADTPFK